MTEGLWDHETFVARLKEVGGRSYHDKHPFHVLMNAGNLPPEAIRGWVVNRFYYQTQIPIKDAAIVSNCPLPRRCAALWTLSDQLSTTAREGDEGGISAWLRLGEACGVPREEIARPRPGDLLPPCEVCGRCLCQLLPATKPWPVAIVVVVDGAFCARSHGAAARGLSRRHYKWVPAVGLRLFSTDGITQARKDSDSALDLTLRYCDHTGVTATPLFEALILQVRYSLGRARCNRLGNMAGNSPSHETRLDLEIARPALAPHVRLKTDPVSGEPVLLFPEGLLDFE